MTAYLVLYTNLMRKVTTMTHSNSANPRLGKEFQDFVQGLAKKKFKTKFIQEHIVHIGLPPKAHKFDLVSEDGTVIIECKRYTWTKSGNVPSAKMAVLDEAILYMRSVPYYARKIIAMIEAHDPTGKRKESLAEYFVDKHGHLLADIEIWEVSLDGKMKKVSK